MAQYCQKSNNFKINCILFNFQVIIINEFVQIVHASNLKIMSMPIIVNSVTPFPNFIHCNGMANITIAKNHQ